MTKKIYIVFFALGLSACASQAPLDDAYYWPDKKATTQTTEPTETTQTTQTTLPMEVINRQDTTITIRIKR